MNEWRNLWVKTLMRKRRRGGRQFKTFEREKRFETGGSFDDYQENLLVFWWE
jgi:hypothetical protein